MNPAIEHMKSFLVPGKRAHLIGIGGVSMRPLGLVLKGMGLEISGSDMNSSVSTQDLIRAGIPVFIGHRAENVSGADCVIRTAAVHNDNPEIQAARAAGIPVFERAQAWGVIMQNYPNAVCFSGTHGKTTSTSMFTQISMNAQRDPTVMIGGYLPVLNSGHRVGKGDLIIMESCEYCNSFLNFFPTVAVIGNIEADHLDFFKDLADVQKSFRRFAGLVPEHGHIVVNGDDRNTLDAVQGMDFITFGFSEGCNYRAVNASSDFRSFDIEKNGKFLVHADMGVVGKHNIYNALSAATAADLIGIAPEYIASGLHDFHGAGRRMEFKGTFNGADLYDDYAHHPGELQALLTAVKSLGYKRIICAFQPHTYTRTAALFDDFVNVLKQVDIAVLAEIYAARESNTIGVSSWDLVQQVPNAIYCHSLPNVTDCLRRLAQPGDLLLTVGAGDIYKAGEALVKLEF
ncbi:MAG: UDP-N-acetylmuramate--L-alanine ligase [Oscillospiraceae bacterium]|nr:UDP-N-acetylmuramate--L-alanine ligase [Oscillospiraceae bacterium]